MAAPPTKVLYLIGTTRCGSTVVSTLLGQVPGVVHVGELARIWEEGFLQDHRCGCGSRFSGCAFWSSVLDRAFGGRASVDPARMVDAVSRFARTRHALQLATASGRQRILAGMTEYSETMARLYRGIREVAGAHTVLDSSKTPLLAWVAAQRPDIDLWALHVTRDPRAVSYSWQRKKFDPAKGEDMHRESTFKTSVAWLTWNALAAAIWDRPGRRQQYLHVRYEDFTADPHAVLDRILDWMGETTRAGQLVDADRRFTGAPTHTIAGNPMRFKKGAVEIAADTEWHERVSPWDKFLVASVTWPLLGRYRYPLLPARALGPGLR